ncbi:MAG TPA: D-alanyl-D-alanine carboxypeptidase family protein [Solirubrobacterales bacterium]|nr:D-alanyl-D-alanine carboxypeptidase family protein [Solirubrobacterales bacterium]
MRPGRHGAGLVAVLLALALWLVPTAAAAPSAGPQGIYAEAWTVVDARSGDVLASQAARRHLPIASTTKLMTAYVAMRELPLDKVVRAAPYSPIYGESLMGLKTGERVSVRDLLYGLILVSGNDAAHTLAIRAAGSEAGFVRQMNRYAAALGLADTHYANPVGLDQRGNYSSAADLATLARRLLREPVFAKIADSRSALLRSLRPPRRIDTLNDLLYMAPWATGVKTGHTFDAGYVLVGSGEKKGVSLVSVAINAPTEETRFTDNLALLEWGFSQYQRRLPIRAGQSLAEPTIRYSGGRLPLRAARSLQVGVRRGQRLAVELQAPGEVEGPIRRGERLGAVTVNVGGRRVGVVALRASRAVPEASAFDRARTFLADNLLPIAIAMFVILIIGLVLLRRLTRGKRLRSEIG